MGIALIELRISAKRLNVLPGQKAEIKTDLVKGSIEQAGPLVKQR